MESSLDAAPQGQHHADRTAQVQEKTRIAGEDDQGQNNPQSPNESEYDSAGSYSEGEVREKTTSRERLDSASDGSVGLERESGDGQESLPSRKVDDDEDKKNPQYIPKRGTFYEHDDRTADDQAADAVEQEKDKDQKKKVWHDKKDRWNHDKFNDTEQCPKSRAELVSIYGYDIRNEEGPPRARRRRRYGRGPNKYTRNWEDEDAYNKPAPVRVKKIVKKSNRKEDFPALNQDEDDNTEISSKPIEKPWEREKPEEIVAETNGNIRNLLENEAIPATAQDYQKNYQPRVGSGRVPKPRKEIKDSDYKGFTTKTRQVRNMKTDQKIVPKNVKKDDFIASQNFTNRNNNVHIQELERDMSKMNVQDGNYNKGTKHGNQRQGSVPPRLQSEQKGSKRYSSIRQRSLPEAATPPFTQPSSYYPNDYNQTSSVGLHQNTQIHPSNNQVPQIAPPPLQPIPQVPVTATPILQAPQFAPAFGPAPPFLQPAPPTFIPQQQPQIINYVPTQPQFPQGFQGYQQQFVPVDLGYYGDLTHSFYYQTQPELYPPQTGITYYSTDQQISQRSVPFKRPKAAIPIVAPPPIDLKMKVNDGELSPYENEINEEQLDEDGTNIYETNIAI